MSNFGPTFDISDDPAKWQMKKGHLKKKQKEVLVKPGDSKKVTSWIWRVQGALTDGDEGIAEGSFLIGIGLLAIDSVYRYVTGVAQKSCLNAPMARGGFISS